MVYMVQLIDNKLGTFHHSYTSSIPQWLWI